MRTLGAVPSEGVQTHDVLREARPRDLPDLRELERAAGAPFRGLGMEAVADDEPPTLTELNAFQTAGRAWVAATRTTSQLPTSSSISSTMKHTFNRSRYTQITLVSSSASD